LLGSKSNSGDPSILRLFKIGTNLRFPPVASLMRTSLIVAASRRHACSLPRATHLLHGRSFSQALCAFRHAEHARAHKALFLRLTDPSLCDVAGLLSSADDFSAASFTFAPLSLAGSCSPLILAASASFSSPFVSEVSFIIICIVACGFGES